MKSLTMKIFIAYWLVMMLVNIASDSIAPEQMRRYPLVREAMRSAMEIPGQQLIGGYESHGCTGGAQNALSSGDVLYLADGKGNILCGSSTIAGLGTLAAKVHGSRNVLAHRFENYQVAATAVKGSSGREYTLFLKSIYTRKLTFLNWMFPGPTTIAVSCANTIVFAILLTLPLRKLRRATHEMASGNLEARVPLRYRRLRKGRGLIEDDLDKLTHDFNHMAERLQGLVRAQHFLLRDVSHELRSPLARLSVALELSRREAGGATQEHLDRIEREAQRLNDLIGHLLSLSYMETTQELRDPSTISLSDLVRDVLPNVQYEATLRGCSITAVMNQDCLVHGDARLLESAFENILRNALRHTPGDGVIEVNLVETECNNQRVAELRVCDRGPGVPPAELDAIMRPFYRVDNSRQSKTGGFGVGLAIADRAVKLHGGSIVATNRPDGGLMVRMRFPVLRMAQVSD